MSNAVALHLSVDADTSDAEAAFDKVGAAARGMADDVDAAARDADSGMSSFGDSADNAGSAAATAAGGFGDLGGALAAMPGPLGAIGAGMETTAPLIQGVTGATDLLALAMNSQIITTIRSTATTIASTVATTAASAATKVWAATQWLLNAAMTANPIGLVVAAIALLVGGVILAYQHSDTFRTIVQKAGDVAVDAFEAVVDAIGPVIDIVKKVLGPVFEAYTAIVKTEIAIVLGVIRGMVAVVQEVAGKVSGFFTDAWAKIKAAFAWDPGPTLTKAWNGIKAVLTKPFDDAWEAIKAIFGPEGLIAGLGSGVVTGMTAAFQKVIDIINKLIRAFNKLPGPDIGEISLNASSSGTSGTPAAAGTRTVGGVPVSSGGGVTININGAIDPYATAQQIRRILARGAVISGRATP
jgi:hypothetical protein